MGKTILITGATDGIGLETAKSLAAEGHTLLVHGRNPERLQKALEDIRSLAKGGEVMPFLADLSDLAAARELGEQIASSPAIPDVILNNAGVLKTPKPVTDEGLDVRFVVNTLAPYLLVNILLPTLGREARVVNVASAAQAPVNIDALEGQVRLADMEAYAQSKLGIIMWTNHLASTHPEGPLFVSVNPGSLLASKMVKEGFGIAGKDISIGSGILAKAALSDEFSGRSGAYYDNDNGCFAPPHPSAGNAQDCLRLTQAVAGLVSPRPSV